MRDRRMTTAGEPGGRLRYLPVSLGLGLFVGDVATLLLVGDLTLGRTAVSGVVAIVSWLIARAVVRRRASR